MIAASSIFVSIDSTTRQRKMRSDAAAKWDCMDTDLHMEEDGQLVSSKSTGLNILQSKSPKLISKLLAQRFLSSKCIQQRSEVSIKHTDLENRAFYRPARRTLIDRSFTGLERADSGIDSATDNFEFYSDQSMASEINDHLEMEQFDL